ncbi:MAG: hypothetical protein PHS60_15190, partial [Zavarzinia sp.]|nr:hypothetical protein [Zavarzinia sp.]
QIDQAATGNVNLTDAILILFLSACWAFMLKQVPSIAGGMVGTVGVSGAGAMAEMFMRPITRALTGAPIISRWMRERANKRFGEAFERGRERARERRRAKARQKD